jgi:hypothetical protein
MIKIPDSCALDPIGAAREHKIDVKALLVKSPPQEKFIAEVITLRKNKPAKPYQEKYRTECRSFG